MNPELQNSPEQNKASVFNRRLFGLWALAAAAAASLDRIEAEINSHAAQLDQAGVEVNESLAIAADHIEGFENLGISGHGADEARWSPDNIT